MGDELRPISPQKPRNKQRGHILTRTVRALGFLLGLAALAASLWYFAGFAENDQGIIHLLYAAILSFGVGGLLYIPAFWISRMAHNTLHQGARPKILPLLLILPWFPVCWQLAKIGGYWIYIAAGLAIFSLFVVIWTAALWRKR